MRSVHRRRFDAPADRVRPWLDRVWSEEDNPLFPHDRVRPFRHDPVGAAAPVPGETVMGHGPLPFVFAGGDDRSWSVVTPFDGHHGFRIEEDGEGCVVEHTLDIDAPAPVEWAWSLLVVDGHDWAIEAIFDRLEAALAEGAPPHRTDRPLPWRAQVGLLLLVTLIPDVLTRAARRWLLGRISRAG